jgi:hypothetical protein
VSQVAGDKAELTEATHTERARRRPRNGRETTSSGGGAPWVCAQCEASVEGCECASEGRGGRAGTGQLEKGWGGDESAASACVVGAESTATRGSCTGGSEGKGPTDGTHGSMRAGERTSGRADERGPRDSGRRCARVEEIGADKAAPLGSDRERGRERAREGADRRGEGWRAGTREALAEMDLLG